MERNFKVKVLFIQKKKKKKKIKKKIKKNGSRWDLEEKRIHERWKHKEIIGK